jgi:hypothetical protein
MNPVNKIPLSFVSRAWHLALALGRNLDLSKNQPLATLFKAVKAVGGVELPVLRTSAAKAELTKEEMDRKLVEDEKKKLRARLASAGKASLDLKTAAEGKV